MKNINDAQQGEGIDFVVLWVDGNDPDWKKQKDEYLSKNTNRSTDASEKRYRDFGLLNYWFRGVEKYAPWVHKIYFITSGQLPDWLNLDASKLVWIKHEDYIPEAFLPTFSSIPIELNMHRIPGLSEKFVLFNDDTFILQPLKQEHYFRNGLPVMNPQISLTVPRYGIVQHAHILLNCVMIINSHFQARSVLRKFRTKWLNPFRIGFHNTIKNCLPLVFGFFTGFNVPHLPAPFLKSTLDTVWEKEEKQLTESSKDRFRTNNDLSQYLFSQWQLVTGAFSPEKAKNVGQYYELYNEENSIRGVTDTIRHQNTPSICINDYLENITDEEFESIKKELVDAFESILPEKSSFEK